MTSATLSAICFLASAAILTGLCQILDRWDSWLRERRRCKAQEKWMLGLMRRGL